MQLKQLSAKFINDLSGLYQEDEAYSLFLFTLDHFLHFGRADYLLKKDQEISDKNLMKFERVLAELLTGNPIQYILGETYFYGSRFKVNPSVLIPRPETEELVDWILEVCSTELVVGIPDQKTLDRKSDTLNLLDIGTGSGCIAISLKKNLPDAIVYALDIAKDTLATAKQNALLNDVEVEFIQDDILNANLSTFNSPISIIVSNPPYIKEDEMQTMHQNVLAHEPHRALFVSNENPLMFYEAITEFALKKLSTNGLLFLEINEYLGQQTVDLLKAKGFDHIELRKDMQGKDRMIKANFKP